MLIRSRPTFALIIQLIGEITTKDSIEAANDNTTTAIAVIIVVDSLSLLSAA